MGYAFPEKSVRIVQSRVEKLKVFGENSTPKYFAERTMDDFKDATYGFMSCLYSGKYAPHFHESKLGGLGFNCTTIIPPIYIQCCELGLEPRIVQFVGFKETQSKEAADREKLRSHFSIVIKIKGVEYLLDPFFRILGEISGQGEHYMRIRKSGFNKQVVREFDKLIDYSEKDFAEMIERCRTPDGSLDMLVACQKIYDNFSTAGFSSCNLFVSYDDEQNLIRSRLYVPQPGIQAKAIYGNLYFSDEGKIVDESIDLVVADKFHWDFLPGEVKIATTTIPLLKSMRLALKDVVVLDSKARIGSAFLKPENENVFNWVAGKIALPALEKVVHDDVFMRMVLARTLYEFEAPEREYVFDEEERIRILKRKVERYHDLLAQRESVLRPLDMVSYHLATMGKDEKRKAEQQYRSRHKRAQKLYEEVVPYIRLRRYHKEISDRILDRICFAQQRLKGASIDELKQMVKERSSKISIGYLAMLADYVPLALSREKDIMLTHFRRHFPEKVRARRAAMK